MSRLPTAVAALAEANQVRHVLFAQLQFKTRTLYLCTWTQDLVWGGATYQGNGDLAGVSPIEEGIDVSPYHVDLALSGLNAQLVRDALASEEFHLQEIALYVGFLDGAHRLQEDPVEIWSGVMDTAFLSTTGPTIETVLRCESHLAQFQRENGRSFTDEDQQASYSGDRFFEYLPQMRDLTLTWGA